MSEFNRTKRRASWHEILRIVFAAALMCVVPGAAVPAESSDPPARPAMEKGAEATVDPGSMAYRLKLIPPGTVTLAGGEYRGAVAPGSATQIVVKLTDKKVFGTVQGGEAGVVVLVTSLGGTGSFYELALLSRGAAGWENSDTVPLGDRVQVLDAALENDCFVVRLLTHGPDDPLCCPNVETIRRFAVRDNRLVPAAEGNTGKDSQLAGTVWQWVQTLYNNDTKSVPARPADYTIRFEENGAIAVKADCNLKGGTYASEGKKLSIRVTRSTMAACGEGSLEGRFVRDLTGGAIFFLKDGFLYIDLKYDTGTMKFSRQ